MPSPFPGMDPYLEGSTWMNFHGQLCAEIVRQLGPKLRPRYLALMTERFVTEIPDGLAITTATLSPDVGVVEHSSWVAGAARQSIATAPLHLATVIPEPVLHFSIEIRDRNDHRLVACIEVVSPTNKQGDGYLEYQRKRNRVLNSTAHLLEIDLLRQGQRIPMRDPLPECLTLSFLAASKPGRLLMSGPSISIKCFPRYRYRFFPMTRMSSWISNKPFRRCMTYAHTI